MIPAADLDQLLLSFCNGRWQKVARIIGKTFEVLDSRGGPISADQTDARLTVLVESGQLEAKGDIKRWGYSEVRLPSGGEAAE